MARLACEGTDCMSKLLQPNRLRYFWLIALLCTLPRAAGAPKSMKKLVPKAPAGTTSAAAAVDITTVGAAGSTTMGAAGSTTAIAPDSTTAMAADSSIASEVVTTMAAEATTSAVSLDTTPSAASISTSAADAVATSAALGAEATTTMADATTATAEEGATTSSAGGTLASTGEAGPTSKEAETSPEAAATTPSAPAALGAAGGSSEENATTAEGTAEENSTSSENTTSEKNMTTMEVAKQLGASLEAHRTPAEMKKAANWEDLGPGDMDDCFLGASMEYVPDMPGEEVTTEDAVEVCQERCKNTTGCLYFTYWQQPGGPGEDKGKCHLQGEGAVKKEKMLTEHSVAGFGVFPQYCTEAKKLLAGMVTFGAPAISSPPMTNPGGKCIGGLRIFTENTKLQPGNGYGQQEDAASMITRFPHARTPTYVLHDTTEDKKPSIFQGCPGKPQWPIFKGAHYGEWGIHGIGDVYLKRIKEQEMPGVPDYISKLAKGVAGILDKFASFTYNGDIVTIRDDVRSIPGWTLTGYAEIKGMGTDLDRVLVVQYDTLDCGVVFQGSQGFYDLMSFFIDYGTGYCGFRNTHVGVRNELWSITSDPDYQALKPALEQCRTTHCIGHSLGGALCELFTGCANSGRLNNSDYKQLAWLPGVPKKMKEVRVPGVDFDVPADFPEKSLPYLSSDTRKANPKLSDWVNKLPIGAAFELRSDDGDGAAPDAAPGRADAPRGIPALVAGGLPLLLLAVVVAFLGRVNRARRHVEASEQVPFAAVAEFAEAEDDVRA